MNHLTIIVRKILTLMGLVFWVATGLARAAHTEAQLLLAADTAKAGDTVLAGVQLKMLPGWHTYWKNPGDAGQATDIKWSLPAGVSAGEIQWPLPKKLPPLEVTTYGYEDEVVLLVPLTLASNLPAGPLNLAAKVSWLECKDSCIPASTEVQATLNVGAPAKPSSDRQTLETWQSKVPSAAPDFTAQALWQKPAGGDNRPLLIELAWPASAATSTHPTADFYPAASDNFEIEPDIKIVLNSAAELELTKSVKKFSGDWPKEISGVLVLGDLAYELKIPVTDMSGAEPAPTANSIIPAGEIRRSFWYYLACAFIGGLILNIMPCVLPVIALKILGFVSEAGNNQSQIRKLGFIYALGVMLSFVTLAAIIIGLKTAGHAVAWGIQFQSPVFIVSLTTIVTLIALNLFGVFEITPSGAALDKAGRLAARPGAGGAFFNGILTTFMATSCSAPILGTALGFAFNQPPAMLLLIFLTIGAGFVAPYLLLSWNPAWLKFLPKPGLWMDRFKIALGFPMLAAVVWLLSVAASSYGKNVMWLGVFMVFVATAAWIFGEFAQRGRTHKVAAMIVALLVLATGYCFALEKELDWRNPLTADASAPSQKTVGDLWQAWSPEAVASARSAGHPVLVDFTADWCLTCRLNAERGLDVPTVSNRLKELGAVALKGDYTHFPDNITAELNRYNRAGVPLVLVYPMDTNAPPIILPELILSDAAVLAALNQAAGKIL